MFFRHKFHQKINVAEGGLLTSDFGTQMNQV